MINFYLFTFRGYSVKYIFLINVEVDVECFRVNENVVAYMIANKVHLTFVSQNLEIHPPSIRIYTIHIGVDKQQTNGPYKAYSSVFLYL